MVIGPYIDVWLKTCSDRKREARQLLDGFTKHFDEAGFWFVSEIFDAEKRLLHEVVVSKHGA